MSETPLSATADLPDRQLFWRWVWSAVRPVLGWVLAALGGLAVLLGWYGVSGQALTAKQVPYLVSGGLPGHRLLILAGGLLGTQDVPRHLGRLDEVERKVDALYTLFAADIAETAPATATPRGVGRSGGHAAGGVLALPAGSSYHRPDCALVANKDGAEPIDAAGVTARGLRPCRVCDPGMLS